LKITPPEKNKMYSFVEVVGRKFLEITQYIGSLSLLSLNAIKKIFKKEKRKTHILKYIDEIGVNSFPLIGILSLFTGMVMVMESANTLKKFGVQYYSAGLVSISMIREIGPVLVALIVAGRVGASITAEIGTMKITEQIDALEVLAVDPVSYLVTPRLIAGIIGIPALFFLSNLLAIVGGFIIGVFLVGISSGMYLYQTFRFISIRDLIVGIIKIVVFSIIVICVSCHQGFQTKGGAEGVGKSTTISVVVSFFLVIFANLILTAIFYFLK